MRTIALYCACTSSSYNCSTYGICTRLSGSAMARSSLRKSLRVMNTVVLPPSSSMVELNSPYTFATSSSSSSSSRCRCLTYRDRNTITHAKGYAKRQPSQGEHLETEGLKPSLHSILIP